MNSAWLSHGKVKFPKKEATIKPSKKLNPLSEVQQKMVKKIVDSKADDIRRPWLKDVNPKDYRLVKKLEDGVIIVWIKGMTYRVSFTPEPHFGIYIKPTIASGPNKNKSPRGIYIID